LRIDLNGFGQHTPQPSKTIQVDPQIGPT